MMFNKKIHKLSRRQTHIVVLTVVLMGIFFSCIQIFLEYGRFHGEIKSKTEQIINSVRQAAISATYNYDEHLAQQIANGVMEFQPIYYFAIIDEKGRYMVQVDREVNLSAFDTLLTWLPLDDISQSIALFHESWRSAPVGSLNIKVSVAEDRQLFFERALIILSSGLARSILLAMVLLFIFKRLITQPFMKMREDLLQVDIDHPSNAKLPDLNTYPNNEFRDVMSVARKLIETIGMHLDSIRQANEKLEERVVERTKALRTSQHRLERAQQIAHLGNWEWSYDGKVAWWSDQIYRILDIRPTSAGKQLRQFFSMLHKDDKRRMKAAFQKLEATGEPIQLEIRLHQIDGSFKICVLIAEVEYSPQGTLARYAGTLQDITRVKQAELALLEQKARSQFLNEIAAIANESPDPSRALQSSLPVVCNYLKSPLAVVHLVEAHKAVYELGNARWLSQSVDESLAEELSCSQERVKALMETAVNEHRVVYQDRSEELAEGSDEKGALRGVLVLPLYVKSEVVATIIIGLNTEEFDSSPEALQVFGQTGYQLGMVFERYRTSKILKTARIEAEQASQAKSDFLSNMSHELRTPLNAILGFAQLLSMDKDIQNDESKFDNVSEILKGGEHLLSLINEVLDLSKIEKGETNLLIEAMPLSVLIKDSLNMIQPLANQKQISLALKRQNRPVEIAAVEKQKIYLHVDQIRMRQAFLNVLSNAIKYTPEEGFIAIDYETKAGYLTLSVQDSGEGIDSTDFDKLFEPFVRLPSHRTVEGTGIGLVITKKLIEEMNGNVSVKSERGKGATFSLTVPLASNAPAPKPMTEK